MSRLVAVSEVMESTPEFRMAALATDRITGPVSFVWENGELVGVFRDTDQARIFASSRRQTQSKVEVAHYLCVPRATWEVCNG